MSDIAVRWRYLQRAVPAVLLVVVVALVTGGVVLGLKLWQAHSLDTASEQAVAAARQESVNLFTLDYTRIDADVDNVLAGATGDFHDEFAKDVEKLKKWVKDNQIRSTGSVLEAGVVSADTDSVTVLVVIDSFVRSQADQKGQPRHLRMQLEMSKVDGRWRARNVDAVP